MHRRILNFATDGLVVLLCVGGARLEAQSRPVSAPHKILLQAEVKPGEVLRYELEAGASFLPIADASGAILTPARGPCDYAMSAIVTLRPQAPDKDGNTPVEARYSETRVTSVRCALFSPSDFQKRLAALQASPVMFRVGPHGETALGHSQDGYFKYWDGGDLLRKVTQDVLQTELSAQPVAAGRIVEAAWSVRVFSRPGVEGSRTERGGFAFQKSGSSGRQDLCLGNIAVRVLARRPARGRHGQRRARRPGSGQ